LSSSLPHPDAAAAKTAAPTVSALLVRTRPMTGKHTRLWIKRA